MIPSQFIQTHRWLRHISAALSASASALLLTGTLHAKPIPSNLGNGLDKLVASKLALADARASGVKLSGTVKAANGLNYTDATTAAVATSAISDNQGRVLVRVTFDGSTAFKTAKKAMKAATSTLSITAIDKTYRGVGVLNAFVDVSEVPLLAQTPGVAAVILEWKPVTHKSLLQKALAATPGPNATVGEALNMIGTTFDQGVTQHRVDQINQFYNPAAPVDYEGQGMQIACISNSYAANAAGPATADVNTNDLPGSATNPVNTTPVFVLQDDLSSATSDDEGRGMVQIAYKMAPKATFGFATANLGEVSFANNIRGLAGISNTLPGQSFAADTICDDVGYFDEPFFQDGIISGGIEDVAAAGVSYFSSAANDIGTNGYDSDTRWVANGTGLTAAAGNTALTGSNINLTGVPANLYAGGFHNFNPNGGLDVAQTVNMLAATTNGVPPLQFQWNDPYDQTTQATGVTQIYSGSGTFTATAVTISVDTPVTAGTKYQFVEAATADPVTGNKSFDAIITVYKSDGVTVLAGPQDTGTDETVRINAPTNDTGFKVKVDHFSTTTGPFSLNVQSFTGFSTPSVSTSLSVLVFTTAGAYIASSSLTTDATTTNQPLQLGYTYTANGRAGQVQYVIARSIVPAAGFNFPTHLRYLLAGNGLGGLGPAEYFSYNTVTTGGHAMSPSCNGCAAYSVFRPSLPETFSSPGPVTIYYDKNDNRLATPEVRLQPRLAFADGANVTANLSTLAGFAGDNAADPDATQGQFYGTSATGPHAAAIAALVLQSRGGPRKVTPAAMTALLERNTFLHDLDPNYASGAARTTGGTTGAGKVTISISSDGSAGTATVGTGLGDTHSFAINYVGKSSVKTIVFNPGGTAATGGNVTGGNNGVTYTLPEATTTGNTATYFENSLPGVAFLPGTKAFTQPTTASGGAPLGVAAAASYSNLSSGTNQYYTMTVTPTVSGTGSVLTGGSTVYFTVGRAPARGNTVGSVPNVVTPATGAPTTANTGLQYTADMFGGGIALPNGNGTSNGMTFSGTTADGGTFSGVIKNNIGSGWSKQDGYGFVNAQSAVGQ